MSCSGPCQQGRRKCPTPEACENEEFQASYTNMALDVFLAVMLTACILFIASLFTWML